MKEFIGRQEKGEIVFNLDKIYNIQDFMSNREGDYEVVASKSGKKYYFPNCSGVKRIKKENLVYFNTVKDAQDQGLELAKNCTK